jgi:hypothetical protein
MGNMVGSASGGSTGANGLDSGSQSTGTVGGGSGRTTGGGVNGGSNGTSTSSSTQSTGGSGSSTSNTSSGSQTTGGQTTGGGGSDGGSATDGSGIPATFDTVKLVLAGGGAIMPCAAAPCHAVGGMAPPGNPLTLQDNAQLYTNLTTHVSAACGNLKVVNPGNPDQSAILKILSGPCGMTPRMPYQCTDDACIPADYIAAIRQWIANGAPQQ